MLAKRGRKSDLSERIEEALKTSDLRCSPPKRGIVNQLAERVSAQAWVDRSLSPPSDEKAKGEARPITVPLLRSKVTGNFFKNEFFLHREDKNSRPDSVQPQNPNNSKFPEFRIFLAAHSLKHIQNSTTAQESPALNRETSIPETKSSRTRQPSGYHV